jgi:hypothetical protein
MQHLVFSEKHLSVLPPNWLWLVDEAIPSVVKQRYSPKEAWKKRPFSQLDAGFFFKGIKELSESFTDDRLGTVPALLPPPQVPICLSALLSAAPGSEVSRAVQNPPPRNGCRGATREEGRRNQCC